jgi:hypothetical protein
MYGVSLHKTQRLQKNKMVIQSQDRTDMFPLWRLFKILKKLHDAKHMRLILSRAGGFSSMTHSEQKKCLKLHGSHTKLALLCDTVLKNNVEQGSLALWEACSLGISANPIQQI